MESLVKLKQTLDEECKEERNKNYDIQVQIQTLTTKESVLLL